MKNVVLLSLLFFCFCSCDPSVSYKRVVENNSSHDIWIVPSENNASLFVQDSFLVQSNSEVVIIQSGGIGQTSEYDNCGWYGDTIKTRVEGNDTLTISKSLISQGNWTFKVIKETYKNGGDCECRLQVNEEDVN